MNPRRLSGYTPDDLQNMGFFLDAVHFFAGDPRDAGSTESPTLTASESETATVGRLPPRNGFAQRAKALRAERVLRSEPTVPAEPIPSAPNLNTAPSPEVGRHRGGRRFLPALPPSLNDLNLNNRMPLVKVRVVRRSKISKLPENVRNNLNALLHSGNSYSHIIGWLNTHGYIGFNKVNLHNWRAGGFQDWLQTTLTVGRSVPASESRSIGAEPVPSAPNLNTAPSEGRATPPGSPLPSGPAAEPHFPGPASPGLKWKPSPCLGLRPSAEARLECSLT